MRNIVAFIGRAGSGKDYQCSLLQKQGYIKLAFADVLREMIRQVLGISEDIFTTKYDELKQTELYNGQNLRNMLEALGSCIRSVDEDFFVKALLKLVTSDELIDQNICISDMRYPNEFYYFDNMNSNYTKFKCIFCDYHSERYQEINNHESALLSNNLVKLGYKDLQVLTRSDIDKASCKLMCI